MWARLTTQTWLWPLLAIFNVILRLGIPVQCLIIRENPVRLRVLEYSSRNGGLQKVLNSRFSDLVVGEEVQDDSQLVLECSSLQGPLRWIYNGDGQPQHKSYYSSTSRASTGMSYTAYLSFPNGLAPKDTGQYNCQNNYNESISNYVYLYVPKRNFDGKQAIFVPNRRKHEIAITAGEKTARIPCAVVHPGVNVSLERVSPRKSFWLDPPEMIPFNPKTGFTVDVSPTTREMYTCRGEYDGQFEEVTYVTSPIMPRMDPESEGFRAGYSRPRPPPSPFDSYTGRRNATTLPPPISPFSRRPQPTRPTTTTRRTTTSTTPTPEREHVARLPPPEKHLVSACTPQYCGINAECIVKDFKPYCVCLEDYTGDAKIGCHQMSDHSQHLRVEDPCHPSPCGGFSECIQVNGHPLCTCLEGYYGSPPKCSPQKFMNCSKNYDCEWTEYCNTDSRKCEDICEGSVKFCGRNALCTAFSHMPYCTCAPGGTHVGDPYDTDGPGCQVQSEKVQAEGKPSCNPSPCGRNAHCKVYSSYPLPICFCPQGFTGDPSHRCYKMSPAPIIDVFRPHYNTQPPRTTTSLPPPTTPFPLASFTMQSFYRPDQLCTQDFCGENARCRFRSNRPECHCLSGYKGDPYKGCHRTAISPQALRQACSVCGPNSVCSMISSDVRCLCAPDAVGVPPNCRRSPTSSALSSSSPSSSSLLSPSSSHQNHQVSTIVISTSALEQHHHHHLSFSTTSSLAKHSSRRNACRSDLDCPPDQICYTAKQKCLNPCNWACSDSAGCSVTNHHVHCRCPIGYRGNGRVQCTKIEEPPKPQSDQQQAVHEHHPCPLLCGPHSQCRGVTVSEMTQLRREALSEKSINMERDPFQRALLQQIKRVSGNNDNYSNLNGGGGGKEGNFTECKCLPGFDGNPYSIEGCSLINSDNHPPSSDDSNNYDLADSPSSSSTIVIQVDPCHPNTHPCGRHSLCVPHKGQAFCRCDFDSTGEPPNCMLRCGKEQHCLFHQVCLKGRCVPRKGSDDNVNLRMPPPPPPPPEQISQFETNLIRKR